jgi:hypothetical protein
MSAIVTDVERERRSGAIVSGLMNTYKRMRAVAPLHLWATGASIRGAKQRAEQDKNRTIHRVKRKNENGKKEKSHDYFLFFLSSFSLVLLDSNYSRDRM